MLWRYIENDSVSASFGLAVDDYLADTFKADHSGHDHIIRLYTYRNHCAILGRFQDAGSEINLSECEKLGIEINRRITGGGAVIMGLDQLGIAIIIPPPSSAGRKSKLSPLSTKIVFEEYSRGIIESLSLMGIWSVFVPKNDILVGGRKITGLAACRMENGNTIFHASIMLDLDISLMTKVLRIPFEKISDKEITKVEDRITTINRESGKKVTIDSLKRFVKMGYENAFKVKFLEMPLMDSEITDIKEIERNIYLTDDWIYQKSLTPSETVAINKKTSAGMINIHMSVMNNIIKDIIITGDFFSTTEFISALERRLSTNVFDRETISRIVHDTWSSFADTISGLDADVLTDCILEAWNKVCPSPPRI